MHNSAQNTYISEDTTNHLFPILRRRKIMAIGISLLCFGISLFAIEKLPPLYHTSAQLLFNNKSNSYIDAQLRHLKVAPLIFSNKYKSTRAISPDNVHFSRLSGSNIIVAHYYDYNAQDSAYKLNSFLKRYIAHINTQDTNNKHNETAKHIPKNNPQYIAAKTKYLALKSQLSAFISKNGAINLHSNKQAQERLHSEALDKLLESKREQIYLIKTLSLRYGEKHPKMIASRKKLAVIDTQIKQEREALLGQLIDNYINAKTAFDALEKIYSDNAQKQNTNKTNPDSTPIAQILNPAKVPQRPISPEKPRLIGFALLFSLLSGILVPIIIERRRKTFICGQQLSHYFGLLCYALIPKIETQNQKNLADFVLNNPSDTLVEALRSLRLNIKIKSKNKQQNKQEDKVILVTSSKKGEGKSTLCTWLGRIAAKSGERVLLIDANLRTPSAHEMLGARNTLSLVEYLTGKADLDKVTDKNDPSGLHVIYGRSVPNSVLDLLSSQKMSDLLSKAKENYDLVIIDTPPCLINADARALSPHADLLLYLVSWNKTKRDVIHKGLSQFLSFAHIRIAFVLSNIDVKKHIQYGYGEVINDEES